MKVLLVDDDKISHIVVKKILEVHRVVSVLTAAEAKVLLKKDKFDVVIIDVLLSHSNGYALASYIRNVLNLDVKIIMYSALPKEVDEFLPYVEKGDRQMKNKLLNLIKKEDSKKVDFKRL